MDIALRPALPEWADDYIQLRGLTRENAIPADRLRARGITAASWASDMRSGELLGFVAFTGDELAGYCFGNRRSGEIVVLALHPNFEGQGIGRRLLAMVVEALRDEGHARLFLGCSPDPTVRSHGFYRHLGWRSTGAVDAHGDELLELPPD